MPSHESTKSRWLETAKRLKFKDETSMWRSFYPSIPMKQLVKIFDCTKKTIYNRLEACGIERASRGGDTSWSWDYEKKRIPKNVRAKIKNLRSQGLTQAEVIKILGVSVHSVKEYQGEENKYRFGPKKKCLTQI
jgi:DNA invertase Pin-like site-specific DNA recombinase